MPSSVALQAEAAKNWLVRLCDEADASVREAFDGASVDELLYWPEEGRLRMTLALARVAEEATPFVHLREHLAGQGVPSLELRVRYGGGALSLGE